MLIYYVPLFPFIPIEEQMFVSFPFVIMMI